MEGHHGGEGPSKREQAHTRIQGGDLCSSPQKADMGFSASAW
jgi:hypothetical protein